MDGWKIIDFLLKHGTLKNHPIQKENCLNRTYLHDFGASRCECFQGIRPQSLTWNLKMMVSKRKLLLQGLIFRFHVKLQGISVFLMVLPLWDQQKNFNFSQISTKKITNRRPRRQVRALAQSLAGLGAKAFNWFQFPVRFGCGKI